MAAENTQTVALAIKADLVDNQISGGAPAGLAFLEKVDGLKVEQQWELLEAMSCGCYEAANRYKVFDKSGKNQLFFAKEKTGFCWRYCCGEHRPFNMNIMDNTGAKDTRFGVIKRDYRCCGWAVFPCCIHHVYAHYTVGENGKPVGVSRDTLVGRASVPWCGGCCIPTLNMYDRDDKYVGQVVGPCCCVSDFCGATFDLTNGAGNKIGELKKDRPKTLKDCCIELNTDADRYSVSFDPATPPHVKLVILAAVLQIDFTFFEDTRSPREGKCCDFYVCGMTCPCCPRYCTCCLYASKEAREKAEQDKKKAAKQAGAPQIESMDR